MPAPTRANSVLALLAATCLSGCIGARQWGGGDIRGIIADQLEANAHKTDQLVNLRSLDLIVAVGFIAAAALFVMWAMKLPIPPRAPMAAFAAAFLALLCRAFLNAFLWPTLVAVLIGLGITALALLRTNWRHVKALMTCPPTKGA